MYSDTQAFENSVDPEQMPRSDPGLHGLPLVQQISGHIKKC